VLRDQDVAAVTATLQTWEREHKRGLVLVGPNFATVITASNSMLASGRVIRATADGDLSLQSGSGWGQSGIELKGTRPRAVPGEDGTTAGWLYLLPIGPLDRMVDHSGGRLLPGWIVTTLMTAAIAVLVALTLSERVLKPVRDLTAAVQRMERGDLDVRVDDAAKGRDEVGDLGRAFNVMTARLADNERLRRQMVTDVAHELRSPVTNLRCTLESMQDGLVAADRAGLDTLYDETLLLQRLISDLQELSLAEAGRLELRAEAVSVGDIIMRVAAVMRSPTSPPTVLEIEDGLPTIAGDPDRLDQILRNLISNAQRHTPSDGQVTIRARLEGAAMVVEVADTGSGLASEHLPHVFDRLYRADRSRARTTGGAGLGLAIVRHLVTAHGGTIEAFSDGLGRGATFVVSLPAARATPPAS
jgi:two-component system sensor histidine kinase BaeS